jgi:hypothetical protein
VRKEIIKEGTGTAYFLPYELVWANFGNVEVKMRRAIAAEEVEVTGKLKIIEIGGIPVEKLIDAFLRKQRRCGGCDL